MINKKVYWRLSIYADNKKIADKNLNSKDNRVDIEIVIKSTGLTK